MFTGNVKYFDAEMMPVDDPQKATYMQLGEGLRLVREQVPQVLVKGRWVDALKPAT